MTSLKHNYTAFQDRIRLGSISIPASSFPFYSFLMGYLVGKHGVELEPLFEVIDLLEELITERLISTIMKKQIVVLMEDFPREIKSMGKVLGELKYGKNVDLIRWIEEHYQNGNKHSPDKRNAEERKENPEESGMKQEEEPVPLGAVPVDGTLELEHSSHTEELEEQQRREQEDIEMARKMQE